MSRKIPTLLHGAQREATKGARPCGWVLVAEAQRFADRFQHLRSWPGPGCCRSLLGFVFLCLLALPGALYGMGLGDLFSATVPVSLQHPPDLGFLVDRVAFATPTGECSDEFVDLLIEDFLRSQIDVMEREGLEKVMQEIDFSASGYVRPEDLTPLGEFMGASALLFVDVQRCTLQTKRSANSFQTKNGTRTSYSSTTSIFFKGSIRVVDTLTGRIHSSKVVEETAEDTASSQQGYPDFPDGFPLKDKALRASVQTVHRMVLPWWETINLRVFRDDKCDLKEAYRLIEIRDYAGALERSLANVEVCKAQPKAKLLGRALYNVGLLYLLNRNYSSALSYFREAHAARPRDSMQEGVVITQKAMVLADAMEVFQAANADRLGEEKEAPVSPSLAGGESESPPGPGQDRSTADRLQHLDKLLEQGLVTKAEYEAKREEILAGI